MESNSFFFFCGGGVGECVWGASHTWEGFRHH
jgi:hypothetical protein